MSEECPPPGPPPAPFGEEDEREQVTRNIDAAFLEQSEQPRLFGLEPQPGLGSNPFGHLPGDCYRDTEEVRRGITIMPGSDFGTRSYDFGDAFKEPFASADLKDPLAGSAFPDLLHAAPAAGCWLLDEQLETPPDFSKVEKPPEMPFGGVAATSITLAGCSAQEVMRLLHAFMLELQASIIKFREVKCTITSHVFMREQDVSGQSQFKVRLYQASPSQLVVEFRRRDRNSLVFSRVFSKAVCFLRSRGVSVVAVNGDAAAAARDFAGVPSLLGSMAPMPLPPLGLDGLDEDLPDAADVQPLLDQLVNSDSNPSTAGQVEALEALVVSASAAPATAVAVSAALKEHAHMATSLLMNPALEVARPAASLASCLVSQPGGSAETASSLQKVALQGLTEADTDQRVREEFARVVRDTLVNFGRGPPFMDTDELRDAVTDALNKPACRTPAVAGRLRESLAALNGMPTAIVA